MLFTMQDRLLQHEKTNAFIIFPDPIIIIPTYLYLNADGAISSGYAPLKIFYNFCCKITGQTLQLWRLSCCCFLGERGSKYH